MVCVCVIMRILNSLGKKFNLFRTKKFTTLKATNGAFAAIESIASVYISVKMPTCCLVSVGLE